MPANIPRCNHTFHYFETYHSTVPSFKSVYSVNALFVGNFTCQVEWKTDSEPLQQIYTVNVGLIKVMICYLFDNIFFKWPQAGSVHDWHPGSWSGYVIRISGTVRNINGFGTVILWLFWMVLVLLYYCFVLPVCKIAQLDPRKPQCTINDIKQSEYYLPLGLLVKIERETAVCMVQYKLYMAFNHIYCRLYRTEASDLLVIGTTTKHSMTQRLCHLCNVASLNVIVSKVKSFKM
jgi:hypothetical protein